MLVIKKGKVKFSVKITFGLCIFISVLIIVHSQKQYYAYKTERCKLISKTATELFQTDIENLASINNIIEALLLESNGKIEKFETICSTLISRHPSIQGIQLAPKGIVSQSYPEKINSNGNVNLFENPETRIASSYSLKTRESYLTGPLAFPDRTAGIIIQQPVFISGENGEETFWGFSVLLLEISNIFPQETLSFLEGSDCYYKLWKPDAITEEPFEIASNTADDIKNPYETHFPIANSLWTIYIAPKDGWFNGVMFSIELVVAIIASLLLSAALAFLLSLKDRDETLERLSYRDSLTSLYNARKFMLTLRELQKNNTPYTLIYFDLNDFKKINDNLGHETGDQVLTIAARKISNCIREDDKAFRIGGDEFTVILQGARDINSVEEVIRRIKESISRETVLRNARLFIVASAGFARSPEDGKDYEEIIKTADNKMYADKRASKTKKEEE